MKLVAGDLNIAATSHVSVRCLCSRRFVPAVRDGEWLDWNVQ